MIDSGKKTQTTVDGRNLAPVDMVNIPLFTGFYTSQVVVWDFFHQQYDPLKGSQMEGHLQVIQGVNPPSYEAMNYIDWIHRDPYSGL